MTTGVQIRERTDRDADALVALIELVQERDGYPPVVPRDSLRRFLFSQPPIAAWVAEVDGQVAGHVALHQRSLDETMAAARDHLGLTDDETAVVARLFVGPAGRGIGGALLAHATAAARELGRLPILDTWQGLTNAVALYDRRGWRRFAALTATVGDETIDIYVYAAPD